MAARKLVHGRKARIVCTLGPATDQAGVLESLVSSGMDAARLNLSYGEMDDHVARIRALRGLANERRRPIAVVTDLPGRKVRVGKLAAGRVEISAGDEVEFVMDDGSPGDHRAIPVASAFFHDNMIRGDTVVVGSGSAEFVIIDVTRDSVRAEAKFDATFHEQVGVHTPGLPIRGGPLTEQDQAFLEMAVREDVDYIGLSYIADGSEVLQVRERLEELGAAIPIIAKIERSEAFARLDGILRRADAVMLRRGDLGAQIELTRVPLVQKEILRLANNRGVPAIIATQMLGSMVRAQRPTRAEASDVSSAIAGGADGVVLSAETAIGMHPAAATQMMARIISETEREEMPVSRGIGQETSPSPFADTTALMAVTAARQTGARLIVCFTESGLTARLVAKYRPQVPMIAFCSNPKTRRRLSIHWGVRSDRMEVVADVEQMVRDVEKRLLDRDLADPGDRLIIVFGAPVGEKGHTNSVRLHQVRG